MRYSDFNMSKDILWYSKTSRMPKTPLPVIKISVAGATVWYFFKNNNTV